MPLEVRAERNRGRFTVTVDGDIDVATYRELRDMIRQGERRRTEELVIDLTHADVVDSSAISVLFGAAQRAGGCDRAITVITGNPHVQRVLELVGMDAVARVVPAPHLAAQSA